MKAIYRGHEINVRHEENVAGRRFLYTVIIREEDGYICLEALDDSNDSPRAVIADMKDRVDAELDALDPWGERER